MSPVTCTVIDKYYSTLNIRKHEQNRSITIITTIGYTLLLLAFVAKTLAGSTLMIITPISYND